MVSPAKRGMRSKATVDWGIGLVQISMALALQPKQRIHMLPYNGSLGWRLKDVWLPWAADSFDSLEALETRGESSTVNSRGSCWCEGFNRAWIPQMGQCGFPCPILVPGFRCLEGRVESTCESILSHIFREILYRTDKRPIFWSQ